MTDFKVGDRVEITGWDVHGVLPEDRVNGLHGTVGSVPKNGPYYRVDLDKPPEFARRGLYCKPDELLPEAPSIPSIPRDVFERAVRAGANASTLNRADKDALRGLAKTATDANRSFDPYPDKQGPGCPLVQAGITRCVDVGTQQAMVKFYSVYDQVIFAYFVGAGLGETPNYFRIED